MAPASGSHAVPNAFRQGIRSSPTSATLISHPRPTYQTSAQQDDPSPTVQQLGRSTLLTETDDAVITEGAQLDEASSLRASTRAIEHAPVSITEAAEKIARDQTAAHQAKLAVLRALSEAFEQATKQFTSDAENSIAKQVATKFLNFWNQSLAEIEEPPKPTYSSVLASGRKPKGQLAATAPAPLQRNHQNPPRLQEQPPVTPPREDLRVFVRLDANAPARNHERYAIRTHIAARVGIDLRRIPAAFPVNTGWAVQASDTATRDLLVQRQADWAVELGAAAVEISQKWHSYAVSECPRRLTDLRGVEINYEEAVKEEIICQTGLKPIRIRPSRHDSGDMPTQTLIVSFLEPTQRPWRLFGASRLARYIDKPSIPSQCDKCWDFHARHSCDRMARCRRCGKTDHRSQECAAPEQCANCLGPHCADDPKCPARPKRVHGMVRRLTREERRLVRQAGAQLFAQQKRQTPEHNVPEQSRQSPDSSQSCSSESQAAGEDGSSGRSATEERAAPSPPCIVVATTPPHASDDIQFTPVVRKTLRIFQANVGKIPAAHDTALALADSERFDLVLLQEPWTGLKDGRCLTKTHPAYDTFSPVTGWDSRDTRPRVMTYVRRSSGLVADQKRPAATRDILWLTVNGVTVVNFYRQPDYDVALEILLRWNATDKCLVSGDFNAKHPSWQAGRQEHRGEDIAFWAIDNRLSLLNAVDVPTNARGSTIDLAFSNIPLADVVVEDHLATGSDHFTLSITLPGQDLAPLPLCRIRLNSDEELKRFVEVDGRVYETQLEKATALRQATLERRTASDDIPDPWIPVNADRLIPFPDQVSFEEARDATLRTGNTSPGSDNITVRMLRAVWHAIGSLVHRLYQGCLTIGHHPKPFREAEVVMIAKLGRRDLSTPRAWRPISLLSCLGKGLERLIARRLAWASIHFGVLHPQQIGALPKRSAVDLVAALVHDIEEAFARKQVATLVTLDIQGAFDTVLCNRLVLRLREQGWPSNLARWVGSFMQDRSARIRYQDIVTDSSPLQCGLPQGSPVSPILFLLYTEPIYRLGNSKGRFGYADDTAILCVGDSLDETSAEASHHVRELLSWGAANGISFDPDKTEVIHFSRTKPKTAPPVLHGEIEKSPDRAMRWLGVWLDSTLSFKTHVEKWTAKAQAVAFHLRTLTNTKHGPLPSAVRRAVCACVIPVLLYAVEAWYPSSTSPRWTKPEKDGPSRIGHLVKKMSKALYTSLRAILPVWRTTPTNVLHREAGIPPVSLLLDARRMAFAARLKALDEAHPLVKRTLRPKAPVVNTMIKLKYQKQPQPFRTRLRRADELLPSCPRPALLQRGFAEEQTAPLQNATKDKAAKEFRDWLQALSPRTLVVYSDGSRSTEGHVGYGYAVHRNGSTILSGKGRLGPAEVFDAEAKGALEGLKAAVSFSETDRIFVCLDNLAAATCLRGTPSDSSQEVFLQFQAIAREHGAVEVHWIPGHADIPGNEEADALAKAGASLPEPADAPPTLAHLRKLARQQPKVAFKAWWQASAPEQYRDLDLPATTGCPPELALSRPLLHPLLAARTHHGDFADYHERLDHDDARLTCSCGRRKDPTHIFYCRKVAPWHRVRLAPSPAAAISRAIGKDFDKFVKLAKASSFFGGICPRH
ncbi:hypothetical protein HIM_08349 [Hirsutella minnesotensis 3608]|uniref:Reverse transcriptase n=1 Tax=Hirsutella minnesotensis 3608 TaxID=1043627 RepID=A0A0F7ZT12_9HYPO|nr:hypothetical protein HIM_08349 [Hirsutella minnesotensis 3608]